jgi:iron(III) transport system substrate-binding protein
MARPGPISRPARLRDNPGLCRIAIKPRGVDFVPAKVGTRMLCSAAISLQELDCRLCGNEWNLLPVRLKGKTTAISMLARGFSCLAFAALAGPAAAQPVEPALAASWAFVQQAMPGVPYALLKAACDDGALMLYHGTWTDAQKAQVEGFKRRFPCIKTVQLFELNAGMMRQRFLSESRAGLRTADIIQDTDPGTLNEQAAEKLYLDYTISNDAAYADGMKKKGSWYPLRIALVGIAWNTDLVNARDAQALKDWASAADPKWKGKAGVVDPAAGGVVSLPWYAWLKLYGEDFIKQVGELRPQIYGATNPGSAALASGEIAVLLNASETGLMPLHAAGAPLRWSFPEPATGPVTGQAINARAPHPNAAKLYHEYAFTEEGYALWQKLGGAPARLGFKDQRPIAAESWYKYPGKFLDYDAQDVTATYPKISELYRQFVAVRR